MADTTIEFQALRFKVKDNGDSTYSISTHDISGGTGVADQTLEIQGFRVLCYDNGDGTFSISTTTSTGPDDLTVEHQGLRFKLHLSGTSLVVDGILTPTYAVVVNQI